MSIAKNQRRKQKRRRQQTPAQKQIKLRQLAQTQNSLLTFSRSHPLCAAATVLCALILLAIFMPNSFQDLQQAAEPFTDQTKPLGDSERVPDSYGKNMLLQTFAADGNVQYQVQAESMQQYLADNSINLQAPLITLNNQGSSPWIITAKDGLIRPGNGSSDSGSDLRLDEKVLLLKGAVSVTQNLNRNNYVRLSSEALTVYPDAQTVRTKQAVVVETSAFKTQALGVIIDLASGRIEFPKNAQQRVRSTFIPTPARPALSSRSEISMRRGRI